MPLGKMTQHTEPLCKKKKQNKNKKQSCFKWNAFNNLAYSDEYKRTNGKTRISSTHTFIYWHPRGLMNPQLLSFISVLALHPLPSDPGGVLASQNRIYPIMPRLWAAAVTHRLTQASSSLIAATWCSAGQASLARAANSWAVHYTAKPCPPFPSPPPPPKRAAHAVLVLTQTS